MIADTSVWIDWLRGDESPPANLLQAELDAGHPVYALPVIIQEILQGARSPRPIMRLTVSFPGCAWTYLSMV